MTPLNKNVKAVKVIRRGCLTVRAGVIGKVVSVNKGHVFDFDVQFPGSFSPIGVHKEEIEFI